MKIVAFEGQGGPHLGVVEGDQVVDLQAVDGKIPSDLGEWLAKNNGDTKQLATLAKGAPASARKPPGGMACCSGARSSWKVTCTEVTPGVRATSLTSSAGGWR